MSDSLLCFLLASTTWDNRHRSFETPAVFQKNERLSAAECQHPAAMSVSLRTAVKTVELKRHRVASIFGGL
jgi:hypothetical protein